MVGRTGSWISGLLTVKDSRKVVAIRFAYRDGGFIDGDLLPLNLVNFIDSNHEGPMHPHKFIGRKHINGFYKCAA